MNVSRERVVNQAFFADLQHRTVDKTRHSTRLVNEVKDFELQKA
ncbi:hypothetical protein LROSL1_1005 [Furfurilactobacillus rossiae]|nr:hypothetical protein LROSL1_1005 [Furfurilactobacillus rossiae]